MALDNVSDYQVAVNQIFYYIDNNFGGISKPDLQNYAGVDSEDVDTLLTSYATYKKTRDARPANTEVSPNGHGDNAVAFVQS